MNQRRIDRGPPGRRRRFKDEASQRQADAPEAFGEIRLLGKFRTIPCGLDYLRARFPGGQLRAGTVWRMQEHYDYGGANLRH